MNELGIFDRALCISWFMCFFHYPPIKCCSGLHIFNWILAVPSGNGLFSLSLAFVWSRIRGELTFPRFRLNLMIRLLPSLTSDGALVHLQVWSLIQESPAASLQFLWSRPREDCHTWSFHLFHRFLGIGNGYSSLAQGRKWVKSRAGLGRAGPDWWSMKAQ